MGKVGVDEVQNEEETCTERYQHRLHQSSGPVYCGCAGHWGKVRTRQMVCMSGGFESRTGEFQGTPPTQQIVHVAVKQPCSRRKGLPTSTYSMLSGAFDAAGAGVGAAAGQAVQEQRGEDALTMPTPSSSARGAATPYMLRQPPTASMNQKPEA